MAKKTIEQHRRDLVKAALKAQLAAHEEGDDEATARFKRVQEALESGPEKREAEEGSA